MVSFCTALLLLLVASAEDTRFREARVQAIARVGKAFYASGDKCGALYAWSSDPNLIDPVRVLVNDPPLPLLSDPKESAGLEHCFNADPAWPTLLDQTGTNVQKDADASTTKKHVHVSIAPSWVSKSIREGAYDCKKSICHLSSSLSENTMAAVEVGKTYRFDVDPGVFAPKALRVQLNLENPTDAYQSKTIYVGNNAQLNWWHADVTMGHRRPKQTDLGYKEQNDVPHILTSTIAPGRFMERYITKAAFAQPPLPYSQKRNYLYMSNNCNGFSSQFMNAIQGVFTDLSSVGSCLRNMNVSTHFPHCHISAEIDKHLSAILDAKQKQIKQTKRTDKKNADEDDDSTAVHEEDENEEGPDRDRDRDLDVAHYSQFFCLARMHKFTFILENAEDVSHSHII